MIIIYYSKNYKERLQEIENFLDNKNVEFYPCPNKNKDLYHYFIDKESAKYEIELLAYPGQFALNTLNKEKLDKFINDPKICHVDRATGNKKNYKKVKSVKKYISKYLNI